MAQAGVALNSRVGCAQVHVAEAQVRVAEAQVCVAEVQREQAVSHRAELAERSVAPWKI